MDIKRLAILILLALVAAITLDVVAQRLRHPYASDMPITDPKVFAEGIISMERYISFRIAEPKNAPTTSIAPV